MRLKVGVKIEGVSPEIVWALGQAERVFDDFDAECVITAVTDGKHREGSLHYVGKAVDLRSKHLPTIQAKLNVLDALRDALGGDFDVILESLDKPNEHFHVEFDPK